MPPTMASSTLSADTLVQRYRRVRAATERLCAPLATEDYCIQSMSDVSPTKWHLAHTSWFFEQFVLLKHAPDYEERHPQYNYLFNSYYNTVGPQHCRPQRGLVSRPTVQEVYDYRRYVDDAIAQLIETADDQTLGSIAPLLEVGANHEQQHQELLVTDIKHVLSSNPLLPTYRELQDAGGAGEPLSAPEWVELDEGLCDVGRSAEEHGFCFDNELPRHRQYVQAFAIADRPVSNGEYAAFIDDGGYQAHHLWLSAGWATINEQGWAQPLYWYRDRDGRWMQFTLHGPAPLSLSEPVCHLSLYEADAYARWAGARLPTEAEWEHAVATHGGAIQGNFADSGRLHPEPTQGRQRGQLQQCFGDVWEWTGSQYRPYPGYRPLPGALGEYNGKFMSNQFVLRGGSCATPQDHVRLTYRNFFDPAARWQFTGLRLARDV